MRYSEIERLTELSEKRAHDEETRARIEAKAVREKGVSFYEYKSLGLSKLRDGLEAHLGPPARWSIRLPGMKGSQDTTSGLSNWRQDREQLDPTRVNFTSIYHTDVEATRTVSGCRQIAKGLQVRGGAPIAAKLKGIDSVVVDHHQIHTIAVRHSHLISANT